MKMLIVRTDRDGTKFWDVIDFSYGQLESTGSPLLDHIRANLNTIGVASLEIIPETIDLDDYDEEKCAHDTKPNDRKQEE
jgi:hypothetical protein